MQIKTADSCLKSAIPVKHNKKPVAELGKPPYFNT